jgi:uncharacterized membrane protein YdjX (TVP38/TMEM64 family)
MSPKQKLIILCLLGLLGLLIYWVLDGSQYLKSIQDSQVILAYLQSLGMFGPVMIIVMMSVAIMVSPLPSAPIAIAAGAAYGHTWGTLYVLLGSLFGAVGAFMVARYFGYETVRQYVEKHLPKRFYDSQNTLMGLVLVTRLMPFLSFDVISYAAGLTPLVLWRFVLATIIGITPASFFLAHVGSELASTEPRKIAIALLVLAGVYVVMFVVNVFLRKE